MGLYNTISGSFASTCEGVIPILQRRISQRLKTHIRVFPVSEVGLRFYSTRQGRWASRDPLGEPGHVLLRIALPSIYKPSPQFGLHEGGYHFVSNAPMNSWDVLGEIEWGFDCSQIAAKLKDLYNQKDALLMAYKYAQDGLANPNVTTEAAARYRAEMAAAVAALATLKSQIAFYAALLEGAGVGASCCCVLGAGAVGAGVGYAISKVPVGGGKTICDLVADHVWRPILEPN